MSEDNPYRFTGGASESLAPVPAIERRLTLRELKTIADSRRNLAVLLFLHGAAVLALLAAFALMPASQVGPREAQIAYGYWFMAAGALFLVTLIGLFFVSSRLLPLVEGRFGCLFTIGLLFPALNAVSACMILLNAKRTLVSRNVRLGWLKDDLSEADADRSFWRPGAL